MRTSFILAGDSIEYAVILSHVVCWHVTSHSEGSEVITCDAMESLHPLNDHNVPIMWSYGGHVLVNLMVMPFGILSSI